MCAFFQRGFLPFICLLFGFLQINQNLWAQNPDLFTLEKDLQLPLIQMPAFDIDEYKKKIAVTEFKNCQFAKSFDLDISFQLSGLKLSLNDDHDTYLLRLSSENAYSLNITIENFDFDEDVNLYLISADESQIIGPLFSKDAFKGVLACPLVKGSMMYLELHCPKDFDEFSKLKITRLGHDFLGITEFYDPSQTLKNSGSCQLDVNCPAGEHWQKEKRSVVKYIFNNQNFCTGALVNNANQDGKAFVLTAKHCFTSLPDPTNILFYFNYEKETCTDNTKYLSQTISGATARAYTSGGQLDFMLLEMSSLPNMAFYPYFAGWDISGNIAANTTSIHHPQGDKKKISTDFDAPVIGNYGDGYDFNSHWKIIRWEEGTTEKGSSGGPLFDQNHRIIGTLTGGAANCALPEDDFFSRMDRAWDDFPQFNQQLKYWLDPTSSGILTLNGYDPYFPVLNRDIEIFKIISPQEQNCNIGMIRPIIRIRNIGIDTLKSLSVYYKIDQKDCVYVNWTGALPTFSSTDIYFNNVEIPNGTHVFFTSLVQPNNQTDENISNDSETLDFDLSSGIELELSLKADRYGNETTWKLLNSDLNTVSSGGPYGNYTSENRQICLPVGNYHLYFYDSEGDGMCCLYGKGYYSLKYVETGQVICEGSSFAFEDYHNFNVQPTSIDRLESEKGVNLFPNPVSDILFFEGSDAGEFEIFNTLGQSKMKGKLTENFISVGHLDKGFYLLKYTQQEMEYIHKILIIR